MLFDVAVVTDIGIKKNVNQDSVSALRYQTSAGETVFAIVCDGMGGLAHGEVASGMIVSAFNRWCDEELAGMTFGSAADKQIREHWTRLVGELNEEIRSFGMRGGFSVGSTITAALFTQERYYIMNIGDSRAYEIGENVRQITVDHTVIEKEVRLGNMTYEQAASAPMKNVLTRCVGVTPNVYSDMFFGTPVKEHVYLLCSDGFRHKITTDEMCRSFARKGNGLEENVRDLVELNKARGETDNISAIAILVG